MKFALYDDHRPGAFDPVTRRVSPLARRVDGHDADSMGWWSRLCGEIHESVVRMPAEHADSSADVVLRAPVLRPGKIVAAASNYAAHVEEMRTEVLPRNGVSAEAWLFDFDVFLKAPSSIADPDTHILIPPEIARSGAEVHHEGELALVIGRGGQRIEPASALDHVLGYTIALDVTLRGPGDRSRRKSYDTFTPIGPWITTTDEVEDWRSLVIDVRVNGVSRQHVTAGDMLHGIPELISYTSGIMRLEPGDVILTGAPPGVGAIHPGDVVEVSISQLGTLTMEVAGA